MPVQRARATGQFKYWFQDAFSSTEYTIAEDNLYINTSSNPKGNNPFGVSHYKLTGSTSTGGGIGPYDNSYVAYPSAFCDRPGYLNPNEMGTVNIPAASQQLLAATNPSRPDILLPVFIAELRDIPEMVKQLGLLAIYLRNFGKKKFLQTFGTQHLAEANLAVQFGWRPFIQDLWTMASFTNSVEKRKKELNSLRQKGGLRRTLNNLGAASLDYVDSSSFDVPIHIRKNRVVTGTCIWMPTYPGSADLTPPQIQRVLTGFDPGSIAADVWEALPWSWFTDYFFNVGQMLQAGNRTIATPVRGWIKTMNDCSATHDAFHPSGTSFDVICSEGKMTLKSTERYPMSSSTQTAHFPTLGVGQLSILGSLAVVKNRKVLGF